MVTATWTEMTVIDCLNIIVFISNHIVGFRLTRIRHQDSVCRDLELTLIAGLLIVAALTGCVVGWIRTIPP